MDEPCSALDPISTRVVEETIAELAPEITIVIVTHNMQQAARVSDQCAFFLVEEHAASRAGSSRSARPRRCSSRPTTRARSTTSPAGSDDATSYAPALAVGAGAVRRDRRGRRAAPAHGRRAPIIGGGSGFAALEIDQWRADTARNPYNLQVNYVSQGSTFGRQQFIERPARLRRVGHPVPAAGDPPAPVEALRRARPARPEPASCTCRSARAGSRSCTTSPTTSGNRITNLQLTRRTACKIFTGAITKWNDPEIVATNPQLAVVQPRHHPGHPRRRRGRELRVLRVLHRGRARRLAAPSSHGPDRARPGERRQRLPGRPAGVELAAELGSTPVPALVRRRHGQLRRRPGRRARTRSPTSRPGTPRCGASRPRRCRTRPASSPSPTRRT